MTLTPKQNLTCYLYYMQTACEIDSFYLTDIIWFDLEKLFGHVSCFHSRNLCTSFDREERKSDGIRLFCMCALTALMISIDKLTWTPSQHGFFWRFSAHVAKWKELPGREMEIENREAKKTKRALQLWKKHWLQLETMLFPIAFVTRARNE